MRTPAHPPQETLSLVSVLHALSDPARLAIVSKLAAEGALPCCALGLSVAKSTASHHFRVLRESGLIQMQPHGAQFINSLRRADLDRRFPGLLAAVLHASSASQAV